MLFVVLNDKYPMPHVNGIKIAIQVVIQIAIQIILLSVKGYKIIFFILKHPGISQC